jgi:GntR family transcriptional regulator/MocR family aminotransferase
MSGATCFLQVEMAVGIGPSVTAMRQFSTATCPLRVAEHLAVLLPDQGINLTVRSEGSWDDDTAVSAAALKKGVVVMPLSRLNVASTDRSRLLLGFWGFPRRRRIWASRLLAAVFEGLEFA